MFLHRHMVLVTALAPLLTHLPLHSCVTMAVSFSTERATSCFCESKVSVTIQKDSVEGELSGAEHEILGLPAAASPPGHKRSSGIKWCRHAEEDPRLSDCR